MGRAGAFKKSINVLPSLAGITKSGIRFGYGRCCGVWGLERDSYYCRWILCEGGGGEIKYKKQKG